MENLILSEDERIDSLEKFGLRIIQNRKKFCFGTDAVVLSRWADVSRAKKICDLGTGTGIIPLIVSARNSVSSVHGLELQHESAELAKRNVKLNGLQDRIRIFEGDIKNPFGLLEKNTYDAVFSNPPFMKNENGADCIEEAVAIARKEIKCSLEDVVHTASLLLKSGGKFYMIHRPLRLQEILASFERNKFSARKICFVHPSAEKPATMVMTEAIKSSSCGAEVVPPLVMYSGCGQYTEQMKSLGEF